jgi:hypothetical protein
MLRRQILIAAASLTAALAATGTAFSAPAPQPDDMSLGNTKAKIEVLEYASLACPHCGHFNETIFPTLKSKYIDTGKVRYTLKEMITEPATVAVAGFLIARCAGPDKYFTVVDQVFRSQPRWVSGNIKPISRKSPRRTASMTPTSPPACKIRLALTPSPGAPSGRRSRTASTPRRP